jgi:hypothetical protein
MRPLLIALCIQALSVCAAPAALAQDAAGTVWREARVLPVGRDLYVFTTNRSPRGEGPSKDRLLRLSLRR